MKKLTGIVIILFLGFYQSKFCYSIPVNLDSLRIEIRNMPVDTLKVIELAKLSKKYVGFQNDTAIILGKDALSIAKEIKFPYGEAYSLYMLGVVYRYTGNYEKAIFCTNEALKNFNQLNHKSYIGKTLNSLGNVYKRKGDFEKALENFQQALAISESINDTILISALYNNISVLYKNMGDYDKALEYQLMNLDISEKSASSNDLSKILMNIGVIYKNKMSYDEALKYYLKSLEKSTENIYNNMLLLHNIAVIYEQTERYDIAKHYYARAIEIEKEIGNKEMLIYSLQGIGNILVKTGNFQEGEKYFLESFQLAKEIGELPKQHDIAGSLQKIYEQQHMYEKSLNYFKMYDDIEDSIYSVESMKQITALEQKYEAEKREQQIAFLEKEQQLQELELAKKEIEAKQKSFQRNILILVLLLAFALVIYYFRANKKRRRINLLLLKQNKKITEQRTEIVKQNDELIESNKTKDRLFQIIAHDLRSPLVSIDSVTQLIPYWIEEQDYESLKKLSSTLELSVQNVLSLIDNLLNWALSQQGKFPYSPENLKLIENISEAIDIYKPIAEIKNIDLKFKHSKNVIVFADRNMLFTVMRNLLNNAIKFTPEDGSIEVGIDSNNQFAKIWVKDSGIGIPEEKKAKVFELANGHENGTKGEVGKGLGLFFCKEFVNINNGDIFIESQKSKGTTITFTLPLFSIVEN